MMSNSTRCATNSEKYTKKIRFDPLSPTQTTAKSILCRHIYWNKCGSNFNPKVSSGLNKIIEICGGIKLCLTIAGSGNRAQRPRNADIKVRIKKYLERIKLSEEKHTLRKGQDEYERSYKQIILANLKY